MGAVDNLFRMNDMTVFIQDNGSLNIQATIIKALIVGTVFFFVKTLI